MPDLAQSPNSKDKTGMPTNPSSRTDQVFSASAPVVKAVQVGKYTVQVINDKCIAAASCVAIAPNTFKLNEQNIAEVIAQGADAPDMQLLAAQSCPTAAVIVIDNETGQQVWPVA